MNTRVTDDDVLRWLAWARNYGEIESFRRVAKRGRKWLILMPLDEHRTRDGDHLRGGLMGHREEDVVPREMVLTSREALVFAYGCAAGGWMRSRLDWTQEDWDERARRQREEQGDPIASN